ncbi:alpha/beta hydrolase [Verrucomicrobium sp. BvORR034]|uniref:esterase/lipase family protein n=1 Tax=Verrucomicrobium sp. BvORR034 TaxID=1396418 RepID=UPI002240FBF6|nr:alpha/beta hydrolase [Verrucomicrobium sp. BvORR034]
MDRAASAWKVLGKENLTPFSREVAVSRYREAVTDIVQKLSAQPPHQWPQTVTLPGRDGLWTVQIDPGLAEGSGHEVWSPTLIDKVRPLALETRRTPEYSRLRRKGVGAPYLAIHKPREGEATRKFTPDKGQYLPMTALLQFDGPQQATLKLADPRELGEVSAGDRPWPVAADFSMPVRKSLQPATFVRATVGGLMRPGNYVTRNGLYLMEPYRADKVPVIFIHGLMADPHIWQAHAAALMADPELGPRIQCWYYVYPTGLPVVSSSTWFRQALAELKQQVDPNGNDPAFQNILVVGHSMGGLIARMQVTESKDIFWKTWFACAPDQLKLDAPLRDELRNMLIFHANPDVKRIIFMNTPHRGSRMAGSWLGRWGSSMVRTPGQMVDLVTAVARLDVAHINPNRGRFDGFGVDGIKSMQPDHPLIADLSRQPIRAKYHTIIGELFETSDPTKSSDGVVPYESAHLDGAESEMIVPSWHGDVTNRRTINEIRRIARLHVLGKAAAERRDSRFTPATSR